MSDTTRDTAADAGQHPGQPPERTPELTSELLRSLRDGRLPDQPQGDAPMMPDEPVADEPAPEPDPLQQAVTALADRVRELDGETAGIRELVQQNTQQVTEILSRFATGIQQQLSQIELTPGPAGPAGSNATLPTDGLSVGSVVLAHFTGATNVYYRSGFSFRPIGGRSSLGPVLRFVMFKHDMRVALGGRIDVGEWRCLNAGMETYINSGSWIGLFVRVA